MTAPYFGGSFIAAHIVDKLESKVRHWLDTNYISRQIRFEGEKSKSKVGLEDCGEDVKSESQMMQLTFY